MRTLALALALIAPLASAPAPLHAQTEASLPDVVEKSIPELSAMLASGKVSSEQLVKAYIDRIARIDERFDRWDELLELILR